MISVEEAQNLIFDRVSLVPKEERPLEELTQYTVREKLCLDRNLPPFHRVTMDGFALSMCPFGQDV